MKDDLKILFEDACPEPRNSAEFTEEVLERIKNVKPEAVPHRPRVGFVGLFCSPVPVILLVAVLLVVWRDRIADLVGKGLTLDHLPVSVHISADTLLVAACCLAVLAVVISCIIYLSEDRPSIDWDTLKSNT